MSAPKKRLAAFVALLAGVACAGGNPRPPYPPVEGAIETTLEAVLPARVVEVVLDLFSDRGFSVPVFSKEDGYVETTFVDVVTGGPGESTWDPVERAVKFRLRVDHSNSGSRLTLEVLYRPSAFLGAPGRLREEMVPRVHPGYQAGLRILERIRELLGAAGT